MPRETKRIGVKQTHYFVSAGTNIAKCGFPCTLRVMLGSHSIFKDSSLPEECFIPGNG